MTGGNELSRNAIGIWGVIFYSVSVISPAFTFTVGSVAAIVYSGQTAPLAFLVAGITTFSAVVALYIFSRYVSNSGGYYKFIEAATQNRYLSKTVGLWYLSITTGVIIMGAGIVAWFVNGSLSILFNLSLPVYDLIILSLIVPLLYLVVGYFRIRSAASTAITIGAIQIAAFTVIAIAFILRTPYNGTSYFQVGNSLNGLHGFFFAMILGALLSYGGYGTVVSLAEEVRFSKRTMKKAIISALVVMVAFSTVAVYSIVAAAGPNISSISTSSIPSLFLTKIYFGSDVSFAIFLVALMGIIFSLVLSGNSGARYAFALARDGILPSSFNKVHQRYKSPYVAVLWTFSISLVGTLLTELIAISLLGRSNGLFYSWAIWGTALMVFSILSSILMNSSLPFFIRRIKRRVNVLTHIVIPSVSSVVMAAALYYSLIDLKSPMNSVYWIAASLIILDLIILYSRRKKARMDRIEDLISN